MLPRIVCGWALIVAFGVGIAAPEPGTAHGIASAGRLDLRGVVQYALTHSVSISARRAVVTAAEAIYTKSRANELPQVNGLLQNQIVRQSNAQPGSLAQYGFGATAFSTSSQNIAQIGTQWTPFNGFYNQLSVRRARQDVDTARADLQRAQQQLVQDVSSAYFAVYAKRATVRLDTADQAFQEQLLTAARGTGPGSNDLDVLRSHVNMLRAGAVVLTAQSDEATARENLAQLIGADPTTEFVMIDALPEPPLPNDRLADLIQRAERNRPDVASATASVNSARLANALIDTDRLPTLQLSASFGSQFAPVQGILPIAPAYAGSVFGDALPGADVKRGNPGFWQIGVTETFQIGLIDYGARHAQHRAAHSAIDATQQNLDTVRFAIETDVRQAYRGSQTAAANLATAKEAARLSIDSAQIAQTQYKAGAVTLTDATQAERDTLSAENDLINARVTYIDSLIHLRVATGESDALAIIP